MENSKEKRNEYMKKFYATHPDSKEKHRISCRKYYAKIKSLVKQHAKDTV